MLMAKKTIIQRRKDSLKKKLEEFKLKTISEFEFIFKGRCGNEQKINTKPNGQVILPGQFIEVSPDCNCETCESTLFLCVGTGKGCKECDEDYDRDVLWFLREGEGESGLAYDSIKTLDDLKKFGNCIVSN